MNCIIFQLDLTQLVCFFRAFRMNCCAKNINVISPSPAVFPQNTCDHCVTLLHLFIKLHTGLYSLSPYWRAGRSFTFLLKQKEVSDDWLWFWVRVRILQGIVGFLVLLVQSHQDWEAEDEVSHTEEQMFSHSVDRSDVLTVSEAFQNSGLFQISPKLLSLRLGHLSITAEDENTDTWEMIVFALLFNMMLTEESLKVSSLDCNVVTECHQC